MKRLALFLLLSGCWGNGCPGWDSTPEATARRMGGAYLASCIRIRGCVAKDQCIAEINAGYCADAGVPKCSQNEDEWICS